MAYLMERLQERSSWLGLIAILTGSGVSIAPELQAGIISIGSGLAGVVGFFTRDK